MSDNCHIETGSCMWIATVLNDLCEIEEGALVYVSAGISTVTAEVERQEGTDYSAPNFGGQTCGPEQRGDTIDKYLNIEGEVCLINWGFQAATSGNPAILDAEGNVVGIASLSKQQAGACSTSTKPRIAMVIVRRAATDDGGCVQSSSGTGATNSVGHFLPNTMDWLWDVAPWEDARAMIPFQAKGYPNPNIKRGPLNLWPDSYTPAVIPSEAYHAPVFIDPASLPAIDCDEPLEHPVPLGANEVQAITIDATGGTFTVTFDGQTTTAIAFGASAATLLAALEALSNVEPGDVEVTKVGSVFSVRFVGQYAGIDIDPMTTDDALLTGGAATAVVTTTTPGG